MLQKGYCEAVTTGEQTLAMRIKDITKRTSEYHEIYLWQCFDRTEIVYMQFVSSKEGEPNRVGTVVKTKGDAGRSIPKHLYPL